ncbi:hypothetical protein [Caballeronia sp. LZ031]|uniref:hypothetical protein n=1 Tax=Caballeronia sp. LZ031 TaxID=3038556 RepID=UPI00286498B3|nr:hypothetical protein [Caballeronia sp. LZ031]MDR5844558.1 hypothetical protein [Caballeronia sp. LZ031]
MDETFSRPFALKSLFGGQQYPRGLHAFLIAHPRRSAGEFRYATVCGNFVAWFDKRRRGLLEAIETGEPNIYSFSVGPDGQMLPPNVPSLGLRPQRGGGGISTVMVDFGGLPERIVG